MSLFGPVCSSKIVTVADGAFANYFNLTEQANSCQTLTAAQIARGCDENFGANWRNLVKKDIINCGGRRSEFGFMTDAFPGVIGATQSIGAKNMYFKSQCAMNYNVQAAQSVSGVTGADVTFILARKDHGANGTMDPINVGQRLLLKGDYRTVEVIARNTSVNYAHTVTVRPAPDYAITITANSPMMVIPSKQRGSYACHTSTTRLPTQGHIYKMSQKIIEGGWEIPFNADLHCDQLQFAKGIDPLTGMEIDMWTTLAKEIQRADMLLTKHTDLFVGEKSTDQTLIDECLEGFQGMIPSIRYGGGNVFPWDPIYGLNPETDLNVIISNADQTKSFKEYYVTCGFQYYAEMTAKLTRWIGNNPGACTYQAFERNGAVDANFVKRYEIKSWSILGYTFHFHIADAFSDIRTIGSQNLSNTAIYYPASRVKDSAGNDVPPVDMYTFATPLFNGMFEDVVRNMRAINGCEKIEGDMREAYGVVFHCLKDWYLHSPKSSC